jgi:hypothetical protein
MCLTQLSYDIIFEKSWRNRVTAKFSRRRNSWGYTGTPTRKMSPDDVLHYILSPHTTNMVGNYVIGAKLNVDIMLTPGFGSWWEQNAILIIFSSILVQNVHFWCRTGQKRILLVVKCFETNFHNFLQGLAALWQNRLWNIWSKYGKKGYGKNMPCGQN